MHTCKRENGMKRQTGRRGKESGDWLDRSDKSNGKHTCMRSELVFEKTVLLEQHAREGTSVCWIYEVSPACRSPLVSSNIWQQWLKYDRLQPSSICYSRLRFVLISPSRKESRLWQCTNCFQICKCVTMYLGKRLFVTYKIVTRL